MLWLYGPPEHNLLMTPPRPDDANMTGLGWRGATLRARPFRPHVSPSFAQPTVHEHLNPHPRRVAMDDEFTPIGGKPDEPARH